MGQALAEATGLMGMVSVKGLVPEWRSSEKAPPEKRRAPRVLGAPIVALSHSGILRRSKVIHIRFPHVFHSYPLYPQFHGKVSNWTQ